MIKCPYCNSTDVFYCQIVEEFHSVSNISKNGDIELLGLDDSFIIDDLPHGFFCSSCDKKYPYGAFIGKYNGIV